MRVIFMGSPAFACPSLQALYDAGHEICAVYTQPPRPAGRGKAPRPQPVQVLAESLSLPVRYPSSLKTAETQQEFANFQADLAVVAAYGLLLPQAILDAPKFGCLNLHPSLLPRWRGAAPINRPILAGDKETGICIMRMVAALDAGPILSQETIALHPRETAQTLHDRLSEQGAQQMVSALESVQAGIATFTPQARNGITYAQKLEKAEGRLDWSQPALEIDRKIRGLQPAVKPWCVYQGETLKILEAEPIQADINRQQNDIGMIIAAPLVVQCQDGALNIHHLQRAGKAAMSAEALLRGYPMPLGTSLD